MANGGEIFWFLGWNEVIQIKIYIIYYSFIMGHLLIRCDCIWMPATFSISSMISNSLVRSFLSTEGVNDSNSNDSSRLISKTYGNRFLADKNCWNKFYSQKLNRKLLNKFNLIFNCKIKIGIFVYIYSILFFTSFKSASRRVRNSSEYGPLKAIHNLLWGCFIFGRWFNQFTNGPTRYG
jgi:hypothetical protein